MKCCLKHDPATRLSPNMAKQYLLDQSLNFEVSIALRKTTPLGQRLQRSKIKSYTVFLQDFKLKNNREIILKIKQNLKLSINLHLNNG